MAIVDFQLALEPTRKSAVNLGNLGRSISRGIGDNC